MRGGPYAAIALAVISVSFASIFITWSTSPPITIALYRLAIATLIIGATIPVRSGVLRRENTLLRIPRRDAAVMALIGGILATHFALWISSLKVAGESIASSVVLVTSHPLLVGLLSHYVLRERHRGPLCVRPRIQLEPRTGGGPAPGTPPVHGPGGRPADRRTHAVQLGTAVGDRPRREPEPR